MIRSSMRASGAPRHTWVPKPKATWCLMLRVTSKRSGSSKTRSSWLADGYMSRSSSPAFSCWPFSSWSRVTVRRMLSTGDTNRTNSSTAVRLQQRRVVAQLALHVGLERQLAADRPDDRPGGLGAAVDDEQALLEDLVVGPGLATLLGVGPDAR